LDNYPSCAFAHLLPPQEFINTPFGSTPIDSVLSYQALEYEKPRSLGSTQGTSQEFPALPIGILDNVLCVFKIESEEQHTQLSNITITLDEAHSLERSTREQSQSTKWQQSSVGRVTASRFGDVLLRQSLPSESFINSFLNNKEFTTIPMQIVHGIQNEMKARNAYCSRTGFTVYKCGLVVNPSVPWLGASPDGLVKEDSAEQYSFGLLEIKCPYIQCFSTVEDACSDPSFFAEIKNGSVTLKESHKHFFQIQGQMALTKVPWCDFVIYTHCNFTIQRIKYNEDLWNDMQLKLTDFYFKYILPKACTLSQETDVNK